MVKIYISQTKTILLVFLSIIFIAGGFGIVKSSDADLVIRIIGGWGGILFGIAGAVAGLIKIFDKKPYIILDENGFVITPGTKNELVVFWNEIEEFFEVSMHSNKFTAIKFKDPEAFIARQGKISQQLYRIN